ncbi:ejaculatory bulb-specific protein 3-like [Macrosteles quadrilineatus]|uniref:ejaculatory bulb-specific protein 3-like n=1 Tax=Macrosteles quadrilineatus TaxID=74068 RepID=UPI0023E09EB9|nr:ejaculatory bulb-specific protein 3-like [Macrosteles quadrilineatus]
MISPGLVVVALLLIGLASLDIAKGDSYTTRFDGIDVEAVLRNERILRRYVDCALDRGPCTAEGKELKKRLPDALKSDCAKCSEVQRKQARRVMEFLARNKKPYWTQLVSKYDPSGEYRNKYGIKE